MKTVQYKTTLFYYDGPQVFEAHDAIGGHYVGVAVTLPNGQDSYLVKGVKPNRAAAFRVGEIDLRTLLLDLKDEQWYLTESEFSFSDPILLLLQEDSLIESEFLPDEGFLLHEIPSNDFVVKEARARNSAIIEFTTESPQNSDSHRMRLDVYNKLCGLIEKLVKYARNAKIKDMVENGVKKKYNRRNLEVDVIVPAATGSFRFVFASNQSFDVFGDNELSMALQRLDALFESVSQFPDDRTMIQQHRGHLAGRFLDLLRLLDKNSTSIQYAWATPNSATPNLYSVSSTRARSLVELLSEMDEIDEERVTLIGEFEKVNRGVGSWGLDTEDGKKAGKSDKHSPALDGLEVGKRYDFHCIEKIKQTATGDEVHTLYLRKYEPA